MKAIEKILRITRYGELAQYNTRLRIWESVSMSWSWDDIHPDYIEESKKNWEKLSKVKAYKLENGFEFVTDYPGDLVSDDNISFERDYYNESSQTRYDCLEMVKSHQYEEIQINDLTRFGLESDVKWLLYNYS